MSREQEHCGAYGKPLIGRFGAAYSVSKRNHALDFMCDVAKAAHSPDAKSAQPLTGTLDPTLEELTEKVKKWLDTTAIG